MNDKVTDMTQANTPDQRRHVHAFEQLMVPHDAVGIHWFGQSSFAFKDPAGTILLVDPYFPRHRPPDEFIHPAAPLDEGTLRANYIVLTHDHGDHTCIESLLRIQDAFPEARYFGPQESMARLRQHGFAEALLSTVTAGDTIKLGPLAAHAIWAKPPEGVPEDGILAPDVEHLGFVLEIGAARVYVSGDLFNTAAQHNNFLDPIVRLRPDIGLLTLHPSEGEFPYFDGSVELAVKLKLKTVVPAHYGCFVKRTYDPHMWASLFSSNGPAPVIIPYNESMVFKICLD